MTKPPTKYELRSTHNSDLKVAIVHDWLVGGGAEKVVLELHRMYPDAPIYTSYCTDEWRQKLDGNAVTGYLQHWPFSKLRKFLPILRALWFSQLDLSGYDLVISSSGAEAKFIKPPSTTPLHVAYIHAPTHYYWSRYNEYLKNPGFGAFDWLARIGLKLLVGPMRRWDYKAAQKPTVLIANSHHTQEKIKEYYGRDSVVVHPPVELERFANATQAKRQGFVAAGRQTPYKCIDLAVAACTQLGLPLTVIGNGPDHAKLKEMAGKTITFVTNASDEDVASYFADAEAFIFPGVDDFGIVAVEALSAGTPVIAYKAGGALDYVVPDKTGLFFDEQTTDSLVGALKSFDAAKYNHDDIKTFAQRFSTEQFHKNMQAITKSVLK